MPLNSVGASPARRGATQNATDVSPKNGDPKADKAPLLPPRHSFLSVSAPGAQVLAFRPKPGGGYEFRVVETEGLVHDVRASFGLHLTTASETDLLGRPLAKAAMKDSVLSFKLRPWKIMTFDVR